MKKKGSIIEHCGWFVFSNVILTAFLFQTNSLDDYIFSGTVNAFSILFWLGIGIDYIYKPAYEEARKQLPKPIKELKEKDDQFYFMLMTYVPIFNTISAIYVVVISGWGKITGRN